MNTQLPATVTAPSSALVDFADALSAYQRLFVTRTFPTMRAARGSWYSSQTPLKRVDLERAMTGVMSLGFYAVSERGNGIWLCLDADTENDLRGLAAITATLQGENLLLERSRRGGHLWVFAPPTPWEDLSAYGRYLVREFGLTKTEVFPKGPGLNGVKAPGSKHPKTGKTYDVLDHRTGKVLPLVEALQAIDPYPVPYVEEEEERRRELPTTRNIQAVPSGSEEELVAEVSRYTTLTRRRDRWDGLCPFHADHHLSFSIRGKLWRCFKGCGGGFLDDFKRMIEERNL